MSDGPGPLYDLACSVPWCCTADALSAMLSIAAREPLPTDEIARRMHGPKSLALRSGQRREDSGRMTMQGPIAVIPIDGPIFRYADMFTRYSGGITTESLARDLQMALDDPGVAAILFAIDSPGGEATGINELSDAIYAARGTKPILAYVEGYGASAAYWIASAAEMVLADDSALIGSIGTILGVPDPSKRTSYRIDIVSSQSPKKKLDPTTEAGRAVLQQLADDMTEVFIAKVMRNRNLTREQVLAVEGGMLVGQQACDAGLADGLGSEERIIRALEMGASITLPRQAARPLALQAGGSRAAKEIAMPPDEKKSGFWAWVTGSPETAELPAALPTPTARAAADMAAKESDPEKEALRTQLAKLQADRTRERAAAFVKETIATGHAYPTEADALTALYMKAAQADAADEGLGLVRAIEAAYTARPANHLTSNLLAGGVPPGSRLLANDATGEAELLSQAEASARKYAERANGKK